MDQSYPLATKLKLCTITCIVMLFLAMLPQINLWLVRGSHWNGAYVSATGDEVIYSAYLNAIIVGRARKNDPFAGKDSTPGAPLPESTFSIQFMPAYAIALVAQVFGVSASTAMIFLAGTAALFASLSVFWMLDAITNNGRLAAAGTLFVLCLAGLTSGTGLVGVVLRNPLAAPILPFLRRYQPAAAFPLFFVFLSLVWTSLRSQVTRRAGIAMSGATAVFIILVFSYIYLWTAAAAWLICISLLWLYFRPADRRRVLFVLILIGSAACFALLPYFYLISRRSPHMDDTQALILTHRPDLFWSAEIAGMFAMLILRVVTWRRQITWSDPRVLCAASLAVLPLVTLNQQVITGKSLQPHHFAYFVVDYCVLLSVVICVQLYCTHISRRRLLWISALFVAWALTETGLTAHLASVPLAVRRDEIVPVFLRLKKLSEEDGTVEGLRVNGRAPVTVFSPVMEVSGTLPTWTSQATLLDMRGLDFGSASFTDRKQFFYLHLYYSVINPSLLDQALRDKGADLQMNFYARSVMWGYHRVIPELGYKSQVITDQEIDREVQDYQNYLNSFSLNEVMKRPLTYAIIPAQGNFDFINLDRWYERDAGERVGDYVLYRLKLRP
jgi:hypothetical protein